jgi:hypothetical protein
MDIVDYVYDFQALSPLLVLSPTIPRWLFFVGEKHQRRRHFLSASRTKRIEGLSGFLHRTPRGEEKHQSILYGDSL